MDTDRDKGRHLDPQRPGCRLRITATPEGAREGELETVGLAVFGKKGELTFFQEWSNFRIDKWLRELFLQAFAFLDEVYPHPGPERHWCLLKSLHNKLSKHKAISEGLDLDEVKGVKGRPWSERKLYFVIRNTVSPKVYENGWDGSHAVNVVSSDSSDLDYSVNGKGKATHLYALSFQSPVNSAVAPNDHTKWSEILHITIAHGFTGITGIESDGNSSQQKKTKWMDTATSDPQELTFSTISSESKPELVFPWKQEAASASATSPSLFLRGSEEESELNNAAIAGPSTRQTASHVENPMTNPTPVPESDGSWINAESFPVAKSTLNFRTSFRLHDLRRIPGSEVLAVPT
ncbi:hypothetical protein K439DRAFT_1525107 [Ramaria rubella]|nr:hypothetical protein K439DRAFT_1525107 [Ramaria rubella]